METDKRQAQSQLICICLILASSAAFASVYQSDFINFDDPLYVTGNPNVLTGLTWSNVYWAFIDSCKGAGYWVPLTWLSLQADATLFGPTGAWGFHLTNLAMHIVNVALFFQILYGTTTDPWRSGLAAALFALHPLRVESVAWATERKDMLSTLFLLMTVMAYCRYALLPSIKRYLVIVACYVLGLMSKPTLVTLPFALLLLDYWPLARLRLGQSIPARFSARSANRLSWLVLEKIPLLALTALVSLLTVFFVSRNNALVSAEDLPWSQRPLIVLHSYFGYLEKSFWPVNLAVLYPISSFSSWRAWLALVPLSLITAAAIYWSRTRPFLIVGWLWFVGILFPVSGIMQVGSQAFADRYSYVPHLGLVIVVVWGVGSLHWWRALPKPAQFGVAVSVLLILGVLSWQQTRLWKNSETLYSHTLAVTERNPMIHHNFAVDLRSRGELDQAESHYSAAIALAPHKTDAQRQYGLLLLGREKFEKAIRPLAVAASAAPKDPQLQYWLGTALAGAGKDAEARKHLRQAFALWERVGNDRLSTETSEQQATARFLLGKIDLRAGNAALAIEEFDRALALQPRYASAYEWRGVALGRQGRWADAETSLLQGLAMNPESPSGLGYWAYSMSQQHKADFAQQQYATLMNRFPDWAEESNDLAIQLLTRSKFRDVARARELAEQICGATHNKNARYLHTLAAAYAAEGDFARARATAGAALAMGVDAGLQKRIEEHLSRYEKGQALPLAD